MVFWLREGTRLCISCSSLVTWRARVTAMKHLIWRTCTLGTYGRCTFLAALGLFKKLWHLLCPHVGPWEGNSEGTQANTNYYNITTRHIAQPHTNYCIPRAWQGATYSSTCRVTWGQAKQHLSVTQIRSDRAHKLIINVSSPSTYRRAKPEGQAG